VPLERGVLSGRFQSREEFYQQDWRRGAFPQEDFAQVQAAVEKLAFLVKGDVPNLAQAALRFTLSHPAVATVIPGLRTVQQVEDNIAASGKPLSATDIAQLHALYQSELRHIPLH
jgi:aryl-alcohol dehydrogenase-like predicted oxidoreductase